MGSTLLKWPKSRNMSRLALGLIGLSLTSYCLITPIINGDIIAYSVLVLSLENTNPVYLHQTAYESTKEIASNSQWKDIIAGSEKRKISYSVQWGPRLVAEWRCKFLPRIAYRLACYLPYRVGVNVAYSTIIISALCIGLSVWPIWRLCGSSMFALLCVVVSIWVWRMDIVGRTSSPDSMACLVALWALCLAVEQRPIPLAILCIVMPLVRPDMILLSILLAVILPASWHYKVSTAILSAIVYYSLGAFSHSPGWSVWFYRDLVVPTFRLPYCWWIRDAKPVTWDMYSTVIRVRWPLIFLGQYARQAWAVGLFASIGGKKKFMLVIIPSIYFALHFLLFPFVFLRFFVWVYIALGVSVCRNILPSSEQAVQV